MQRSSQNVLKMASIERNQRLYECRKEGCGLKYTLSQNWNRHEKAAGHMPPKRIEVNEPFYDAHLKLFKCMFPNCQVISKRKSNLKKHMKNWETQKKSKVDKNACPYCKATFSQKYNQNRYVKKVQY